MKAINAELEQLASYSLRSGTGSVGYQSEAHKTAIEGEKIRIDLGAEFPIDQIVLVPTIRRDPNTGLQADGFPAAFQLIAGTDDTSTVVASYTEKDKLLPRIAPLAISFPSVNASWIELQVSHLTMRSWGNFYVVQLSEIMVFSGLENVALTQAVTTSSQIVNQNARDPKFLVDGYVPYLMDAANGSKSKAVTFHTHDELQQVILTIDLEKSQLVNQINLHMTDLSHTIPEATLSDHAVPRKLRVISSNDPYFSEQTTLFEFNQNSIYDVGPILMRRFPETKCRYIQVQVLELQPNIHNSKINYSVGFAEIEILSKGQNIALHKPILHSSISRTKRSLSRLTDGNNFLGEILPTREWMNQLARRHDLITERPRVAKRLSLLFDLQKKNLQRMYWIAALLAICIALAILIERLYHLRQLEKMRTRFAADLHDELGANLHAIGLLGDLAKEAVHSPKDLIETVDEIRALTERTGKAARYCADVYEAQLCGNLKLDMQRSAQRILADIDYELIIEGDELLQQLKPRTRADLFLFYKESLVNVSRHSEASHCVINCIANHQKVTLTIFDNGIGIIGTAENKMPASLKRRAKLLKAKLNIETPPHEGTKITLQLRRSQRFITLKNS
ncbi:sensor histidine kinase [Rubritalea spongiae]